MNTAENRLKKRPDFLSALCLLTFAGSGGSFAAFLIAALFFEKASAFIIKYSSTHETDTISPFYFVLLMALSAVSLAGAIRMWKLHRDGFFLYFAAQTALIVLPVAWLGRDAFSAPGLIITIVFFVGYAMNWGKMK